MIDNKIVILCPEIVPMDNKGEEAIIKGIMDLMELKPDNCIYQVIDHSVTKITKRNDLILHPVNLFFPSWKTKEFGLGFSYERIYSSLCALLRHALNRLFPRWKKWRPGCVKNLQKYIKYYNEGKKDSIPSKYIDQIKYLANTDNIIAGHNGGLDENVCHVLLALKEIGYKYTIFGSCMKPNVNERNSLDLFDETLRYADNVIIRNPIGYRWYQKYFSYPSVLAPDPAYYMQPLASTEVHELIKKCGLAEFMKHDTIMVTTAEPAPISLRAFDDYKDRPSKIKAHRDFLAQIVKDIIDNTEYNILFLPHTIGPEEYMDDRLISHDVLKRAGLEVNSRCRVLENNLTCRELKGLISLAQILIAERVHSVIGAVGVHTPFICMASDKDNRVNGMLIELAGLGQHIFFLNKPSTEDFRKKLSECLAHRSSFINELEKVDENNKKALEEVSKHIIIPTKA